MGLGAVQEGNDLHLAAIVNDLVFWVVLLFLQIVPYIGLSKISASLSVLVLRVKINREL